MAYNYTKIAATALRLIAKYGETMTFRAAGSSADPVTGLGGTAGATRTMQGVVGRVDLRDYPETVIQSGDKALIVEGGDIAKTDKWVNGSEEWHIVAVSPIAPNGTDIVAVKVLVRA